MSTPPRPRHLGADYASQFADGEVAAAYRHRPPYPDESALVVRRLLPSAAPHVLELGAGSGDFTVLMAPHVAHVTAVEPSLPMREIGKQRTAVLSAGVEWLAVAAEELEPKRRYDAVVAAESLHWMDWEAVLPRVAACLRGDGPLILVERVITPSPWDSELRRVIASFSINRDYRAFDLHAELEARGLWRRQGECLTGAVETRQSIGDYVESFHSRNGFSRARMTAADAASFDAAVESLVRPHAPGGCVSPQVHARVCWGQIIRRVPPTHPTLRGE